MGRNILVFGLVFCIWLDRVSSCPPSPAIPGLEQSVKFLGTVSAALGERREDGEGNPLPITASITLFKGLPKFSSLAGGVIGLAGFILDHFKESDFAKIIKEFGKVEQQIADLKFQFDKIANIVKKEHAWTRMHPNLQFLDTVSKVFDQALNSEHEGTRHEYKTKLLSYYQQGRILEALSGIYCMLKHLLQNNYV